MKPETAAKKLGVLLAATPEEFRAGPVTRTQLNELLASPPEWLAALRRTGPHPRSVVAARLGVSIAGLRRQDMDETLTTEQIQQLLREKPDWLARERATNAQVMAENARRKHGRSATPPAG